MLSVRSVTFDGECAVIGRCAVDHSMVSVLSIMFDGECTVDDECMVDDECAFDGRMWCR